jgi:hypothetical protein
LSCCGHPGVPIADRNLGHPLPTLSLTEPIPASSLLKSGICDEHPVCAANGTADELNGCFLRPNAHFSGTIVITLA